MATEQDFQGLRRRSSIRLAKFAAGSALAAASVASMAGVAGPAAAATTTAEPAAVSLEDPRQDRLDGVREDLGLAVRWRLVTQEQAEQFLAQIERRIARGL